MKANKIFQNELDQKTDHEFALDMKKAKVSKGTGGKEFG